MVEPKKIDFSKIPRKNTSFYYDSDNILLFQKIRSFNRDINFEKQVHDYHYNRESNPNFRERSSSGTHSSLQTSPVSDKSSSTLNSNVPCPNKSLVSSFDQECLNDVTNLSVIGGPISISFLDTTKSSLPYNDPYTSVNNLDFFSLLDQYGRVEFK
ncbi:hypothetical protein BB560_003950 [Smittium megazygosporum]|uniref:Uncharacterized protein n=1 Tax=Smittium megazygosporum TaxID=133381 RepID=A0A2T9ZAM1_9FUNG|nr:hypothetical protein BB560_003950 [Smittium megazygosporum]